MDVTNEIVRQILEFLERVGGAIVQEGFRISVTYVYANAIGNIILFLILLSAIVVLLKMFFHNLEWMNKNSGTIPSDEVPPQFIKTIISGILGVFLMIGTLIGIPELLIKGIKMLIAPEWYAIQSIIDLIK